MSLAAVPITSSLRMVPVERKAVGRKLAPVGAERVSRKLSLVSAVVSPTTFTVTVLLVAPAAKVRVPEGKAPPLKSVALAGGGHTPAHMLSPPASIAQVAVLTPEVLPVRVTVNRKGVKPLLPSA